MLSKYFPYEYIPNVFKIDYEKLYKLGYKGIIFDIDNTLVHHGDDSNKHVDKLIFDIQNLGLKVLLLSDNDRKRVERFTKNMDVMYICDANKPSTLCYKKALKMMQLKNSEVVVIGDQIFKDILGANNSQIASVLVKYIVVNPDERIGIKRYIEKLILLAYRLRKKYYNRLKVSKES